MEPREAALAFVEAINQHDVEKIMSLMTHDHIFVDTWDNRETKEQMAQGWPGYFAWFPDYHIELEQVMEAGDVVALFGYASGTYRNTPPERGYWRLPAVWRVRVTGGLVKVWQVYADAKVPFDIMESQRHG